MPLLKRDNVENHLYHNYFLSRSNGNTQTIADILAIKRKCTKNALDIKVDKKG